MTLELRVNGPAGFICQIRLAATATLQELQAAVEAGADIPSASQLLFHDRQKLHGARTVGEWLPVADECVREEELLLVRKNSQQLKWLEEVEALPAHGLKDWFRAAPNEAWADKDVILAAVAKDGLDVKDWFRAAPEEAQADKEVVLVAVAKDGMALEHASPELQRDCDVASAAAVQGRLTFRDLQSSVLRNSPAVVTAVWRRNPSPQQTQECRLRCFMLAPLGLAPRELRRDRDFVSAWVAKDGRQLAYAPRELRGDHGVVMAAVAQDGMALEFASKELRTDRDVIATAVAQNAQASRFASAVLQAEAAAQQAEALGSTSH